MPRVPQQRPEAARQRHRFVQDGGVPVVVLNHRPEDGSMAKERVSDLERQLANERAAHETTRRMLSEAQAGVQASATRLAHAALAHQEELNAERRALATAQRLLNEALMRMSPRARAAAVAPAAPEAAAEPEPAEPGPDAAGTVEMTAADAPDGFAAETVVAPKVAGMVKKRGRPRIRAEAEPKPVRWWTPSFRAKQKG